MNYSNTYNIDILGLAETNLNWHNRGTKESMLHKLKSSITKNTRIITSSANIKTKSNFLPGGTMMISHNQISNRTSSSVDKSPMGRWTSITLQGKRNNKITIITTYRANKNDISRCGPSTIFSQQWHYQHSLGIIQPNPRQSILEDLETYINELKNRGDEIIIMMDANESTASLSQLSLWINNNNLIDIHQYIHGPDDPETYNRGSTRIDYILISPTLAPTIKRAGITAYSEVIQSDHRMLFIDIDLNYALNLRLNKLFMNPRRGVTSSNPKSIKLYRKTLTKLLDNSNLEDRLSIILKSDQIDYDQLEAIDDELTNVMLKCDKQCMRISQTPWSPQLHKARANLRFWKLWLTQLRIGRNLEEARNKCSATDDAQQIPTIAIVRKKIRDSCKKINDIFGDAIKLREIHLQELAHMAYLNNETSHHKAINTIMKREQQKRIFNRLRSVFNKNNNGSMDHLIVQNNTSDIIVDDPSEIEDLIIKRNKKHFSQADGSPFTTTRIIKALGKYGESTMSQDIFKGIADIESLSPTEATAKILSSLKSNAPQNSIPSYISPKEMENAYRAWREQTSTSPSGIHLGHTKALYKCEDHNPTENTTSSYNNLSS